MNRAMRRKADKQLKQKLSTEQFEILKSRVIEDEINNGIRRFTANFVEVLKPAMREARISEERIEKIVTDLYARSMKKYRAGDEGADRPEEERVSKEEFLATAAAVLERHGISNSAAIAEEIRIGLVGKEAEQ